MSEKKVKINLKFIQQQLDGNELDLSMNGLDTVPVKELLKVRKGSTLDLSKNSLHLLPEDFGLLDHLVRLDLSNNQLCRLPDSFGKLSSLQKLDLYGNQLTSLPLTFWQLKKLRWLDLKKNPLEGELQELASKCVTVEDCTRCASQVLAHVKKRSSEVEREHQNELRRRRELEEKKKEEEARLRAVTRKEKAAQRSKRKAQEVGDNNSAPSPLPPVEVYTTGIDSDDKDVTAGSTGVMKTVGRVLSWVLLLWLLIIILLLVGVVLCPVMTDSSSCSTLRSTFVHYVTYPLHMLRLNHSTIN